MTRSNRRACRNWSKLHDTRTLFLCEECGNTLVHQYGKNYVCSVCGLEQIRVRNSNSEENNNIESKLD